MLQTLICQYISNELAKIDPKNAESYKTNVSSYIASLKALDNKYQESVSSSDVDTVLFGDRFLFRYLVDDYGLKYYAIQGSGNSYFKFNAVGYICRCLKWYDLSFNYGKVVRMQGACASYKDPNTGIVYYACIIQDATACCSQGLEFALANEEEYPEAGTEITVTGTFEIYEENGYQYIRLADSTLN